MEQNLKELLLKDLCARLPYGVRIYTKDGSKDTSFVLRISDLNRIFEDDRIDEMYDYDGWKPYLRPMSSMTEKEEIEISKILNYEFYLNCDGGLTAEDDRHSISMMIMDNYINFLLSHHFDFRRIWDRYEEKSMIELGLALPAPDGMYNLEKK